MTGLSSGGSSGSSSSGSSNRSAGSGKTGAPVPVQGDWIQEADGTWSFQKQGGEKAVSEWIYTGNTDGQDRINGWYRFDEKGRMETGWFIDAAGKWYYLNKEHDGTFGAMKTGWVFEEDGHWYYLNPADGSMMTGWQLIGGKWYYFNPTVYGQTWVTDASGAWKWGGGTSMPYGAMYADMETPDGYRTGPDGDWME